MRTEQYTNVANLPQEIVQAIMKDRYTNEEEDPFDYSATTIINPPRITILKKRHPDKLVVRDVQDYFWMFLGSVAHQLLEDAWHESMGSMVEERLYATVLDKVVAGKIDCYGNKEIRDYKFTKVYKIMKNDFTEWEQQLNIYAWLLRKNGYPVEKISIYAFLNNWQKGELYKKNYPKDKIHKIDLPVWTDEKIEAYLEDRITILKRSEEIEDDNLLPCTPREMWQDVKDYAITKKGASRATRTFETEQEALDYYAEKKYKENEYYLEKRLTQRTRCFYHCPVANLCSQHKYLCEQEGVPFGEEQWPDPVF